MKPRMHWTTGYLQAACVGSALGLVAGGCTRPLKPIFPELIPPIQWPAAPQAARIRYVGSLHCAEDLHPAQRPLAFLGELFAGKKASQPLCSPRAVVTTRDGERVWIADPGGRCLHLFDLRRREYKKIERFGRSPLLSPVGLCLGPEETVFVCDSENAAVYRFSDRDGGGVEALRLSEELLRPVSLHYDETAAELWVADASGHDLKVLSADGTLKRIVGHRGTQPGEFNFPSDLTGHEDQLWVADAGNHRVQAITRAGEPTVAFGQAGDASGDMALPKAVGVDPEGRIYVLDGRFENVQIFDPSGHLLLFFGEEGTGAGQFWLPGDIFIEPTGRIWVCDSYNKRVQVFVRVEE